ncbi:MAG: DUF11 domain-containing protein, partial [Chloroflexi bacterium]|nr:DUF11 domain-containing protein [Chloroflexota bacterium]
MKINRLLVTFSLGLVLTVGALALIGQAAPGNPVLNPPRNSHTAPLTTTVSITYDEPISVATVTSRTFAVHGMQSGLVTATHTVRGGTIVVTPTRPFHQGELVYIIATTRTLNVTGTEPLSATQWQFRAGRVVSRCVGCFADISARLIGVKNGSVAWGDYDNDGDLDILITGSWYVARLYRNDGDGIFTEAFVNLPGVSYSSVAWGDYDNDGDLDILLTGYSQSGPIGRVYRNDGKDTFTDISAGLPGVVAGSVAWGDYDNDGDLDILLAGTTSSGDMTQVWRNENAESFIQACTVLTGVQDGSVAWGDYDNDGDLDILLTGYDSTFTPVTQVWCNDNAESFVQAGTILTGVQDGSVAWGDYDNDGDLDILLTGYDSTRTPVTEVWRNDGGENFTQVNTALPGVRDSSAAWGDYDNDGDLDVLLTGYTGSSQISRIYRNDAGSFIDIDAGMTGVRYSSVAWGDYDNDGDLDILLAGSDAFDTRIAKVYRNDDCVADLVLSKNVTPLATTPGSSITYTLTFSNVGTSPAIGVSITDIVPVSVTIISRNIISSSVVITDASATPAYVWHVQDLAPGEGGVITITGVLSPSLSHQVFTNTAIITTTSVDGNPGNNSSYVLLDVYLLSITTTIPSANAVGVPLTTTIVATFDGDLDVSTVSSGTFVAHGMQSGLVTGTFGYDDPRRTMMLTPTRAFYAGEIVRASATKSLLRTDGEPLHPYQWQFHAGEICARCVRGFTNVSTDLIGVSASSVAWGDYDTDGDLDILLAGYTDSGRVSRVYRNDGGDIFTDISVDLVGMTGSVAWGDYDNDGDLDILLAGYTGSIYVSKIYRNDGTDIFTDISADLARVIYSSVAWGDYDNDGDLDILLTGYSTLGRVAKLYRNDGADTFTDVSTDLIGVEKGSVAWGDYDNDGDLDILLTGFTGSRYVSKVYRNDGRNKFTDISANLTEISNSSVAWGDYDNDGDLDILLAGHSTLGRVAKVYRNDGKNVFTDISAGLVAVTGSVMWGDYDNDGNLDILLTGSSDSDRITKIYRNGGGDTFTDISADLSEVSYSSAAWGDYDNDGDLDIIFTGEDALNLPVTKIYRNEDCVTDLSIVKFVTPQDVAPDQTITYTLNFSNTGTLTATRVIITDTMPVSVTNISVISSGVTITSTSVTPAYVWQVQNLAPGESGIIIITGQTVNTLSSGDSFTNTTIITTTSLDVNTENNHSSTWAAFLLHITDTIPTAQALGMPLTTTVSATFDNDVDPSTISTITFAAHGMMSGLVTGTLDYDTPGRTLTLFPAHPFHAGEIVRISATDGIQSTNGIDLAPYQWQFTAGIVTPRPVGGCFTDINAAGLTDVGNSSVAWGDYDNDGDLDILLAGYDGSDHVSQIYRNDNGSFADINAGLTGIRYGSVAWGDYDNDGDLDVLLVGSNRVSKVYRNDGSASGWTFTNINAALTGVYYGSAMWGDYDNDGDLDILLTGIDDNIFSGVSKVYRNDGPTSGWTFTDINAALTGVYYGSTMWGDYDSDGDLDILLTGQIDDYMNTVSIVYRNDNGEFTDINAGIKPVDGSSVIWGDYDNDGDLDILLTGDDYPFTPPVSWIYRNDNGSFTNINAGLTGVDDSSAAWGDYDNDGDLDILLTGQADSGRVSKVYRNDAGSFADISVGLPGVDNSSVAWGDYDNDGDLDILLTGTSTDYPYTHISQIYRNDDCPNLALVKTVTPQIVAPSDIVTYTLAFINDGTLAATHVIITDHIPVSVTNTSVVSSGVAITDTGTSPTYVWSVQNLAPGDSGTITITGILNDPLAAGIFTNTTVITATGDRNSGNNSDSAAITVMFNALPIANAGADQTVITTTLITLDGSGSSDPDAHIPLVYGWTQTGGAGVSFNAALSRTTFAAPPVTSLLTFSLAVTDALDLAGATPDETLVNVVAGDASASVDPMAGGGLTYTGTQTGSVVSTTIEIPGGAVSDAITLVYDELSSISHAAPVGFIFAGRAFNLEAYLGAVFQEAYTFDSPITLTLDYTLAGLSDADEATLELRYWDGDQWNTDGITVVEHDAANHRLVVTIEHLTEFAIFAQEPSLRVLKTVAGTGGGTLNLPRSGVVTYTIELSNSGGGIAHGVVMTDILPLGINFHSWVVTGSATLPLPSDIIEWGPHDIPAGKSYTIRFTAQITSAESFAGETVTNTASLISTNAGSSSDDAVFTISSAVNTPPSISTISDQSTTANTPTDPIPFTIRDTETASADLALSAASSNITLVPTATIVFGGSGFSRTVAITPAANLTGIVTITITVTDEGGLTNDTTFALTVDPFRVYLPLVLRSSNSHFDFCSATQRHFWLFNEQFFQESGGIFPLELEFPTKSAPRFIP